MTLGQVGIATVELPAPWVLRTVFGFNGEVKVHLTGAAKTHVASGLLLDNILLPVTKGTDLRTTSSLLGWAWQSLF